MSTYNNSPVHLSTFTNTYAQENEAEIEADIEQENKCKKDTECENENELNNQLSITNITQAQQQDESSTLNVIKIVQCEENGNPVLCENLAPEDFTMTVTGNNPSPSQFQGSQEGTLVTLGPGEYFIDENIDLGPEIAWSIAYSGDCIFNNQEQVFEGTIAEGETQTCTLTNILNFVDS